MPLVPEPSPTGTSTTRTLLRGLQLLELVADNGDGSVTGLAAAAGLDKGTTSRLLATLRAAGYIRQDTERRYHLAGKVLRLADSYTSQLDLRTIARPHLEALRNTVDETVHLGVMEDDRVLYIDKIDAIRSLRLVSRLGHTEPVHTTSLGRAILSRLSAVDRDRLVAELDITPKSARSPADRTQLMNLLEDAARRGFAIDDEENQDGVMCVGAAVLDVRGAPVAAVSCSGPAVRMAPRLEDIGQQCRTTAEAISDELTGHRPVRS